MQDVTITFTDGPLRGRTYEFEVGHVLIGRLPGNAGLELKGADTSVSRVHAELRERGGEIEVKNASPNGTIVNGKLILESVVIRPDAELKIGANHPFTVNWTTFEDYARADKTVQTKTVPAAQGPMSSPIVRAVLGVYMLGMVVLGVWLMVADDGGGAVADDWPALIAEYDNFDVAEMADELRQSHTAKAESLVRELRLLKLQGYGRDAGTICRDLMSIDGDARSPVYQYGARCLGAQ